MADSADRPYRDNPEVSHETSDVNVKSIVRFAAALAFAAVVIHLALYGLLGYYEQRQSRLDALNPPRAKEEPPPEPRLRVAPRADLAGMRKAEEQLLRSYGWIDREKNIIRVPIEQGMEMILKQGLPVRKQTTQESKAIGGDPKTATGGGLR